MQKEIKNTKDWEKISADDIQIILPRINNSQTHPPKKKTHKRNIFKWINKYFFKIKKEKNGYRASVGDDEKFLKINGDGCNILWMYVLPLNHILKMTKMIHLCYVYFITKHTFF